MSKTGLTSQGGVLVVGGCRVDGRASPLVKSPEEMIGRFQGELITELPVWKKRLKEHPDRLAELEREVHASFSRGADLLVVGLLAVIMKDREFEEACERSRKGFAYPLERGRSRQIRVRLLGGLLMWVTTLYCAPRSSSKRSSDEKVPGVYVELMKLGFGKGCTPGLESRVARQAGLCPSLKSAQQELARDGVTMNIKTVRRITNQCGEGLLQLRTHELLLWREGRLPAGRELAGKRVSVQLDGGRSRIRGELREATSVPESPDAEGMPTEDRPGRSRKRPRRTFDADWREPKLLTIFVHDENGRMVKCSQATVDGTFQGPDAVAELVAMHLHRLGAAQAESVTFVSDGGVWIWDRIPTIVRLAQLEEVSIYEVLDCYHAAHHISGALAAMGLDSKERLPLYREHRTLLRNGQWRRVVEELTELAEEEPEDSKMWTEIAYLRKHGEAGRLKYPTFRRLGLPLGSGAIESNIRRVINLRMKGNSIYWREENAEAMLQIRAQILTDRWDERLIVFHQFQSRHGGNDWRWIPNPISSKVEDASSASCKP